MKVLVTGGAGFMGSHFVELLIRSDCEVAVADGLVYPGSLQNLPPKGFVFFHRHLVDTEGLRKDLLHFAPDVVVHFAAESHVDSSIESPLLFVQTNVLGTASLLEASRDVPRPPRFVQISTDEVFGDSQTSFGFETFDDSSPYRPSSPYSSSKAAADHLVRAWSRTYGLSSEIVRTTNNYGPRQAVEKLIPRMLNQLFQGLPVGLYGDGEQERDWIFVQDFCEGLFQILQTPLRPSSTRGWILAGQNRRTNRQVARELIQVCRELDPRLRALSDDLIQFVKDRPGHDRSYRVDDSNERTALEWKPNTDWTAGLRKTVQWYWAARGKNALSGS